MAGPEAIQHMFSWQKMGSTRQQPDVQAHFKPLLTSCSLTYQWPKQVIFSIQSHVACQETPPRRQGRVLEYLLSSYLIYHAQKHFHRSHALFGLWAFSVPSLYLKYSLLRGQIIPFPDSFLLNFWDSIQCPPPPGTPALITHRFLDSPLGCHNILHMQTPLACTMNTSVCLYHPHHFMSVEPHLTQHYFPNM